MRPWGLSWGQIHDWPGWALSRSPGKTLSSPHRLQRISVPFCRKGEVLTSCSQLRSFEALGGHPQSSHHFSSFNQATGCWIFLIFGTLWLLLLFKENFLQLRAPGVGLSLLDDASILRWMVPPNMTWSVEWYLTVFLGFTDQSMTSYEAVLEICLSQRKPSKKS